jgi:membrane associated rhomboid family serine protease
MFPRLAKKRIRQVLPLLALASALVGAGIGSVVGQPNSWAWALGGAAVACLLGLLLFWARRRATQNAER